MLHPLQPSQIPFPQLVALVICFYSLLLIPYDQSEMAAVKAWITLLEKQATEVVPSYTQILDIPSHSPVTPSQNLSTTGHTPWSV